MADFINTIDALGDDAVMDSIIRRTITEFHDDALSEVGYDAFRRCTALTNVKFPAAVELKDSCFYECTGLEKADFSAVTQISSGAFVGCSALKAIALRNTNAVVSISLSSTLPTNGYVYVPSSLVDNYKTASGWSTIASRLRKLEEWTVDGTVTGELDIDNRCMVRFFNDDGTLLSYKVVPTGGSATYDGDEFTSASEPSAEFIGFVPEPTNVTADMDCYATWKLSPVSVRILERTLAGAYRNDTSTTIGREALNGCKSLTSIVYTKANDFAYRSHYDTNNVEKIDIYQPSTIASQAFCHNNTSALTAVILRGSTMSTIAKKDFVNFNLSTNCYVYVPKALIDTYKADSVWSSISSRLRAIEDYPNVCGG